MDYEEIISKITSGLTGNSEKDVHYLKEQADQYRNHKLSKEVLRAIGRLLYDVLPDDQKDKASEFYKEGKRIDVLYDEVRYLVSAKQYEKATIMIDPLIQLCEESFKEDEETDYFSFKNIFQAYLYQYSFKPLKEIKPTPYDFSEIYIIRGFLYLQEHNIEAAIQALNKAVQWNPVNVYAYFQLGEANKFASNFDEYLNLTKKALSFATTNAEIARCYRNVGFYFIETEKYPDSINMYYLSNEFEKNEAVSAELFYISQKTGLKIEEPEQDEILKTLHEYDIQIGASEAVIGIAQALGEKALETKQIDLARYCLGMTCELTGNEEAKEMLGELAQDN